jgi:hypothetical protein
MHLCTKILLITHLLHTCVGDTQVNIKAKLHADMFANYNRNTGPWHSYEDIVTVHMEADLYALINLVCLH